MPSPPTPSPGQHVPFSHAEARALMAELGIPPNALWARITTERAISASERLVPLLIEGGGRDAGGYWAFSASVPTAQLATRRGHGYRLELFGPCSIRPYDPRGFEPPPWRYWWAKHPDGVLESIIRLWRERAFRDDSPLYAELLWHPERGERHVVGGFERLAGRPTARQLSDAWRGFELLRRLHANAGRPPGKERYPTEESYRAAIRALHERAEGKRWNLGNAAVFPDDWIADKLGISTTTLYERKREHGISMNDIREGRV